MKKKFFIGLFIFAAVGLFIFAHIVLKHNDNQAYRTQQNLNAPIEIPDESIVTYEEALKLDKPFILMFYVDWCSYCRRFMPVFGEIAKEYKDKYTFAVINCDYPQYAEIIKNFHIMGFPTIFLVDNKINHKFSLNLAATTNKSIFKEEINNYLNVRKNFIK